jgi:hypothetical protein
LTVGSLMIRVAADTSALRDGLIRARAQVEGFDESVRGSSDSITKASKSWLSWGAALKVATPVVGAAGLAVLQMTGNMGALASVLPVLNVALGALLAPFASLAAIIVSLVGPLAMLGVLAGGLAAAFGFTFMYEAGQKTSYLYERLQSLRGQLGHLAGDLTRVFMPVFMDMISAASKAVSYFDQLAQMPLAQAFKSLSTTGVKMFTDFMEKVGSIVAKPLRLAVQFAFGTGGANANSALGGLWDQVRHYFAAAAGGKPSIDKTIENWFGRQDFTAIGMRWGTELAGALMGYFGQALQHVFQSRGGKMLGGGAVLGGIVGAFSPLGPLIGTAVGAGIGSALGITLNHYWPRLRAGATEAFNVVRARAIADFHAITTALEHFLGPTTWHNLGAIARSTWTIIRTVAVGAFRAIVATGRTVWAVFNTLIIKTGVWKVALAVVKAAIFVVAAVLRPIISLIARIVSAAVRLGGVFNGAVLGGVRAVASAIGGIISGIQTAIGLAQSLASALSLDSGKLGGAAGRKARGAHSATGNFLAPHQASIVGERGPELFIPSGAGNVIPNHRSFGSARGGGGGDTYLIFPNVVGLDRHAARQLARDIQPHLGRQVILHGARG